MSTTVDDRVVALEFDNKKFEDNVGESLSTLEKLKEKLNFKDGGKGLEDLQKNLDSLDTDKISAGVEALQKRFSTFGIIGMRILENLTDKAMQMAGNIWDNSIGQIMSGGRQRALNLEQANFQLMGLFKEVKGNAPKTAEVMKDVGDAVEGTSFSLDQAAVVASQLAASNIQASASGGQMLTVLKGIAGTAAMTGSDFQAVGNIFTKVAGNGRLMGTELLQLSGYGMNAAATIRDYWNETLKGNTDATEEMRANLAELSGGLEVTEADIREFVSAGQISFDIFSNAMNNAFGEHAQKANDTYAGSLSNVKSALSRIGAKIYMPYLENMRDIFNALRPAINDISDALTPFIDVIVSGMGTASKFVIKFLNGFHELGIAKPILQGIFNIFKGFGSILKPIGKAFSAVFSLPSMKGLTTAVEGFAKLTEKFKLGEKSAKVLEVIFKGLFTVVKYIGIALGGVIFVFSKFFGIIGKGVSSLVLAVDNIASFVKQTGILQTIAANIKAAFSDLPRTFTTIKDAIGNKFSSILKQLAESGITVESVFERVKSTLSNLSGTVSIVGDFFGELFKNIQGRAPEVIANISKSLTSIFNAIKANGPSVLTSFIGVIKNFITVLSNGLPTLVNTILRNFTKILQIFAAYATPIGNAIFDIVISGINVIGSRSPELITALANALKMIVLTAFSLAFSAVTSIGSKFLGSIKDIFATSRVYAAEGSEGVKESVLSIGDVFSSVKQKFQDFGEKIAQFFKPLTDKIKALFKGMNILDIINTGSFVVVAAQLKKFVDSFKGLGGSISDFFTAAGDAIKTFTKPMSDFQKTIKPSIIIAIALAIGILALSIYALSKIDIVSAGVGLGVVSAMLFELVGALKLLSNVKYDNGQIMKQIAILIATAFAVNILANAISKLSAIESTESLFVAAGAISLVMMILIASVKSLAEHVKEFTGNKRQLAQILIMSSSIIALATGVSILTKAMVRLSGMNPTDLAIGLGAIGAILAGLAHFVKQVNNEADLKGTSRILIAFALSLLGLYLAIKLLGSMEWTTLGQGLSIIALLLIGLTYAIKNMGGTEIKGAAATIMAMAIALNLLVAPIFLLGHMKVETLRKGLLSLAAIFVMLGVSVRLMANAHLAGVALTVLALAVALNLLIIPIRLLGGMGLWQIFKGIMAIIGVLSAMAVAISIMAGVSKMLGSGFSANLMVMSLSLIALAGAMALLAIPIKILGGMKVGALVKGIAALLIALGGLGLVAGIMGVFAPAIIAGAIAIGIFGLAILGLGVGLTKAAGGLLAFAAIGIAAATTISAMLVTLSVGVGAAVVNLAIALGTAVGELLGALGRSIKSREAEIIDLVVSLIKIAALGIIAAAEYLGEAIAKVVLIAFEKTAEYTPKIVNALVDFLVGVFDSVADAAPRLIESFMNMIGSILGELKNYNLPSMESVIKGLLGITAVITILRFMPLSAGIKAVGVLAGFMVGFTALLAAFGGLNQIPGFSWLIGEGMGLLAKIGEGLGLFVGSVIGGLAAGLVSGLPIIAVQLSMFAKNLRPFLITMSTIDSNILTGVQAIAGAILALSAAELINGLTNLITFFTGGSSFATLGEELAAFGPYMATFAQSVAGVDGSQVTGVANAIKTLAEAAAAIPNEGGWISKLTGDNAIDDWGNKLPALGRGISMFAGYVVGIDTAAVSAAAEAVKTIAGAAQEIPNAGGLVATFVGDNDIEVWGQKLPALGRGVSKFSEMVSGIDTSGVVPACEAAKRIAEVNEEVPNAGGAIALVVGDNDIAVWGEKLPAFGKGIYEFGQNVSGFDNSGVEESLNAASKLADLNKELGGDSSWLSNLFGSADLTTFGQQLPKFGEAIMGYGKAVDGIPVASVSSSVTSIVALVKGFQEAGGLPDTSQLPTIGDNLKQFAPGFMVFAKSVAGGEFGNVTIAMASLSIIISSLEGKEIPTGDNLPTLASNLRAFGPSMAVFATSVDGISFASANSAIRTATAMATFLTSLESVNASNVSKFKQALNQLGQVDYAAFVASFRTGSQEITTLLSDMFNKMDNLFKQNTDKFKTAAGKMMDSLKNGFVTKQSQVTNAVRNVINAAANAVSGRSGTFYNAGVNGVQGFINGLRSKDFQVTEAGREIARLALEAAKRRLDEHSPSKEMYRIGNFAGVGFVQGMKNNFEEASKSGKWLAEYTLMALNNAISLIDDENLSPTITPVIDLTNVQNGINSMQSMFAGSPAYALASSNGMIVGQNNSLLTNIAGRIKPTDNNDVVDQLASLRSEVRDLNNAMSKMQIVMDNGALVGQIAAPLDARLGKMAVYKGRGN